MKEFKGTKGTWAASPNSCFYDIEVIDNPIRSLAFNIILLDNVTGKAISLSEENKANAQLISKAPEMLALLQGIAEEICTLLDDEDLTDDKLREFSESTLPNIYLQILTQIKQATEV